MWRQPKIAANHCAQMRELRERFDVSPLVIHASYLINVAAQSERRYASRLLVVFASLSPRLPR